MSTTPPGGGPAYETPAPPGAAPYAASYAPPLSSSGKRFGAYLLEILLMLVTLVIGWIIWSLIVWGKGLTPAKQLLRMQCVDANTGEVSGWGTMALRELVGKLILGNVTFGITTIIGGVMVLTDDRHQALWDKIATTVVVDVP
jgi:uncharacterized RDD family membrane protein YckC